MYLRFESPALRDAASRCNSGLFAAFHALRQRETRTDSWQMCELTREYNWFCDHLDAPEHLIWRTRRSGVSGVCWFRAGASEHIRRARYMAWLLCDLG